MRTETIRRHATGALDVEFYRAQALRERSATLAAALRASGRLLRKLSQTILTALTQPAHRPMPDPGAVMLIAQAAVRRPSI